MFLKLLNATIIGVVIAVVLLVFQPSLRVGKPELLIPGYSESPLSFNQATQRAAPAVVNVYSGNHGDDGNSRLAIRTLGSGVIMNQDGYILTNKHVINNADQIIVTLQDARVFDAQVVGSDTLTDLAVLKIQDSNLPVIPINHQRIPRVGDVVLAIGNPYNLGQTITQGIISATGRNGLSPSRRQNFLQTDASINHGNSGGALVNSLGELVGINTLSFDKNNEGEVTEGLGFAIPTILATKVMEKLIRDGRVIRGFIGIEAREIISLAPEQAGDGKKRLHQVIVTAVTPDGPADRAGILPDDILLVVDNKPVESVVETMDQIAEVPPDTEIPITILRNGEKLDLELSVLEYLVH